MIGKFTMRNAAQYQVIPATCRELECFTRDELRAYAKSIGVEIGQDKEDTMALPTDSILPTESNLCPPIQNGEQSLPKQCPSLRRACK